MEESAKDKGPKNGLFSYDSINDDFQDDENDTGFSTEFTKDGYFIGLKCAGSARNPFSWKVHLSLYEDENNIRNAWDAIVDILINYKIQASKVLRKGKFFQEYQKGKEITIYFQEGDIAWSSMLEEIENALLEKKVLPNYHPIGDKQIEGSQFLSCRQGEFLLGIQSETHNPSGKSHIFESLSLKPHFSPAIKIFRKNEQRVRAFYAHLEKNYFEVLKEFRANFPFILSAVEVFSSVLESRIEVNLRAFPGEVSLNVKQIIRLGKEIETIRHEKENLIENMDEKTYQIYFSMTLEKFKRMKEFTSYALQVMKDNPEASPNSSENSVVRYDSDGKVKDSDSEENAVNQIKSSDPNIFRTNYAANSKRSSTEEGTSFSDDADKSFEKHVAIPEEEIKRHGLFLHVKEDSAEKQKLFTQVIPETLGLGVAIGKGDCFYDTCAQELNEIFGTEEYSLKVLRLLCHTYAVELDQRCGGNPNHADNWIAQAFNDSGRYQQYLANVQYTVEEREAGEGLGEDGLAIWGDAHLDGKIICKVLKALEVKLHVIEMRENPEDATKEKQKFIISHNVIDESRLKNVGEEDIDWQDKKTIHIAVCNLHFVPILKKTTLQKCTPHSPEIQKSSAKISAPSESPREIAVDSSVDETSSFSEDFKHRSAEAEESPRTSEDTAEEIQPKSPGMRR